MTGEHSGSSGRGGVIWICGLAGVGKTTLAIEVARLLPKVHANVLLIDGDEFRRAFMPEAGYERAERLAVARAISRHAWEQAQRGNLCVVATISLFTEIHDSNRHSGQSLRLPFVQSFLSAPPPLLVERRASLMRCATNIVGTDIKAEMPNTPDHAFVNDGCIESLLAEATTICGLLKTRWQLAERSSL